MKKLSVILLSFCGLIAWTACEHAAQNHYIDLNSGDKIAVVKDDHGRLVDAQTKKPVRFYVDTKSKDTVDGRTGRVVNGELVKVDEGDYEYISVRESIAEDEEYKRKIEGEGEIKIKHGNRKIKIKKK
jgi:hypothetical protein